MDTNKLLAVRTKLKLTQEAMAALLRVSLVGYKRFESGTRPIPAYVAFGVRAVEFLHKHDLLESFEVFSKRH